MNITFKQLTDINTYKQLSIMEECIKVTYRDKKKFRNKIKRLFKTSLIGDMIALIPLLIIALVALDEFSIKNFIVIYLCASLAVIIGYKTDCNCLKEKLSYTSYVKDTLLRLEKRFDKTKKKQLWTNMNNFEYFENNKVTFHSVAINKDGFVKVGFLGSNSLIKTKRLYIDKVAMDPEQKEKICFYFENGKAYATLNEETYKTFSNEQTIELTII